MKNAVGTILLAFSFPAFACFVAPSEQHTSPGDLIERTKEIALAKVVAAETQLDGDDVTYTFQTVRHLKGQGPDRFQISGYPSIWVGDTQRFDDHMDNDFWSNNRGRSATDTDCEIHPTFSVGGTYLVFLDQPYHVKSFELIISAHGDDDTRDKWLQYVESYTGP
jgi:hypothetical protein